jgi:predicted TIM-barrel fold metal-dependent hydrolase
MPVIDFRARPNTPEYMALYDNAASRRNWEVRFKFPKPPDQPLEAFMASVAAHGIDRIVFTGRQTATRSLSNDYIAACVQQYPDRIIGFAGIDVASGLAAVAELERAVATLGLRGVSLDPHAASAYPSDPAFYPIYRKALELDVPVVFTMGPIVGKWGHPQGVDDLAREFPDLKIVCSHGIWPQVTEFLALAYRHENVYLETSIYEFLPGGALFVEFANDVMPEKILYASAFPFRPLSDLERYRRFPFKPGILDRILWDNPARLLKIV